MGGSQSQERVVNVEEETVSEDGPARIIVTEDFVQYLHDKQTEREDGPRVRGEKSQDQEDKLYYDEKSTPPHISDKNEQTAESANRPRYSSDEAERWKTKYELEKQKNQLMKETASKEFDKVTSEIREKFDSKIQQSLEPVCEDCKNKVLECYRSNPGRPLNCSAEAKEYIECVEQARRRILQSTGSGK